MQGRQLQQVQLALMGIGVLGLVAGGFLGTWPGLLGMLSLLGWAAGQAGSMAWDAVKGDEEMTANLLGMSCYHCTCLLRGCCCEAHLSSE